MSSNPKPSRSLQFALFVTGCLWLIASMSVASRAAQGIADRFNLNLAEDLLEQAFLLFLLLVGFSTMQWVATRHGGVREANALPQRATTRQEFLRGSALGWGMLLVVILPMALGGCLHLSIWYAPNAWGLALLSLVTLALSTLALEVAFRGYVFARLIAAIGPTAATILLSLVYAALANSRPNSTALSIAVTFLTGVLFSLAYLRTHALWLGWGMHFAWNAAMAVVFGLPLAGYTTYSSVVTTNTTGPDWFTGGYYGLEGAFLTALVVLAAIAVLYRITRTYAWEYTHPAIVAAGYAVVIAPPAAHTAMEQTAAPAQLVNILGTTSTAASTLPVIDEHLRRAGEQDPTE